MNLGQTWQRNREHDIHHPATKPPNRTGIVGGLRRKVNQSDMKGKIAANEHCAYSLKTGDHNPIRSDRETD